MVANLEGKKLLVLGANHHQTVLIRRARERGAFVITSDRNPAAPGVRWASLPMVADILDQPTNIRIAQEHKVDGVVTVGTDQPLTTVAAVANACALPCHVTPQGAFKATHKVAMSAALSSAGVPITKRVVLKDGDALGALGGLRWPRVVKPADSQGQVGIRLVGAVPDLRAAIRSILKPLSNESLVIEEFVEGPEITVSAWVVDGEARLLAVTDRVTYNPPPSIGIALRHVLPSKHAGSDLESIGQIVEAVATAYGMSNGPLYIQMIAGPSSLSVIEAAARVGGGHEIALIPAATGVDIIDASIDLALGKAVQIDFDLRTNSLLSAAAVNFVVARPGLLHHRTSFQKLTENGLIADGDWYRTDGYEQRQVVDAYGRIGWFLILGAAREEVLSACDTVYRDLVVEDSTGRNLVYWPDANLMRGM